MTREELALHARNTLGYSERMTQDLLEAYDLGAKAEREECAKVCDNIASEREQHHGKHFRITADECAAAIMARSNV